LLVGILILYIFFSILNCFRLTDISNQH
jgi:hypothetical protein